MKPAERVEAVLRGEMVDKVPFTVYEALLPQCTTERLLRNNGLCIINRNYSCYSTKYPNCTFVTKQYEESGRKLSQTIIRTPVGEISSLRETADFSSWSHEPLFKKPEDYKVIKYWIKDAHFFSDYDTFSKAKKMLGSDVFLRVTLAGLPLQNVIHHIMGIERFSIEWAERRDEVMKLCDALAAQKRKIYPILAESPAFAFNYGGNLVPEIIGKENFEKYIVPHFDEFAEILHEHGKVIGSHFDANNRLFKEGIADSKLDYIEAFTPPPDCDMSVSEARKAWPDKVLWINFPSSVHLASKEVIEETTKKLIYEAAPGDKYLFGITEDVPENCWKENFYTISQVIKKYGKLPIKVFSL